MRTRDSLRRLGATCALALAAGCATTAPERGGIAAPEAVNTYAVTELDLGAKFKVPDRERGRRDRARVNAQFHLELEADEKGPPSAAQIFRATRQREQIERATALEPRPKGAGLQPSQWQSIGPSNVGGRVRAMAFDPRTAEPAARRHRLGRPLDHATTPAPRGAPTRTSCRTCRPRRSCSTPSTPNNVYMGTGEASAGLVGVGVFKSTDGGETWRFITTTNVDVNPDWRFVNRLAIHPTQTQVLLAGVTNNDFTSGAIYRSTDGGENWTRVFDAAARSTSPSTRTIRPTRVAGLDDGTIAFSRDGGVSWQRTAPLVEAPSGRGSTRARGDRIRALAARQRCTPRWTTPRARCGVRTTRAPPGPSSPRPSTWATQGDYDNAIWVDPFDADARDGRRAWTCTSRATAASPSSR